MMSILEQKTQLRGKRTELEARRKKADAKAINALMTIQIKAGKYVEKPTDLDDTAIVTAAEDLRDQLAICRECEHHIDNIDRQLHG